MSKKALVVKKSQIFSKQQHRVLKNGDTLLTSILLENIDAELMDRSFCETDEDYFQLIPYITLLDPLNGKFFTYMRGGSSGESRLIGKCSVGLGGHIEEEPDQDESLGDVIKRCILRELHEEIGIDFSTEESFSYILGHLNKNFDNMVIAFAKYSDDVSKVHLAVPVVLLVDSAKITELSTMESGVITQGKWMSKTELNESTEIELEEWSKIVLAHTQVRSEANTAPKE